MGYGQIAVLYSAIHGGRDDDGYGSQVERYLETNTATCAGQLPLATLRTSDANISTGGSDVYVHNSKRCVNHGGDNLRHEGDLFLICLVKVLSASIMLLHRL